MSAFRMLVWEECPETDVYLGAVLAHGLGHLLTGAYECSGLTLSPLVSSHHQAAHVKKEGAPPDRGAHSSQRWVPPCCCVTGFPHTSSPPQRTPERNSLKNQRFPKWKDLLCPALQE